MTSYLYYPPEEFGFDTAAQAQEHRRVARPHESTARMGASLRPDARSSAAAIGRLMACTHNAAMAVLAKLDVAFATEQHVAAFGSAAAR
jgi:hypothetical protein